MKQLWEQIRDYQTAPGQICLWYLGQEGFAFKYKDFILVVDPYLTDSIDRDQAGNAGFIRNYPPPVLPKELKLANLVLCTHDHQDHLDPETIRGMDSGSNLFGAPVPVISSLGACGIEASRILPLEDEKQIDFSGGSVIPIRAAHDKFEQVGGKYRALSFLICFDCGITVFHGGDMMLFPGLEERLRAAKPNLLLLPINGRCFYREQEGIVGNIGYREAVDLARRVGPNLLVPMHHDLYPANGENPAAFVDYLWRTAPGQPFHLFAPGEALCVDSQNLNG